MTFWEVSQCSTAIVKSLRWRHNDHAGVSNHQPPGCLLNRLFRRKSKKTSKLRVTGLCAGNSPGTGEFSAQMASYAENVSIWWRHHVEQGVSGKSENSTWICKKKISHFSGYSRELWETWQVCSVQHYWLNICFRIIWTPVSSLTGQMTHLTYIYGFNTCSCHFSKYIFLPLKYTVMLCVMF